MSSSDLPIDNEMPEEKPAGDESLPVDEGIDPRNESFVPPLSEPSTEVAESVPAVADETVSEDKPSVTNEDQGDLPVDREGIYPGYAPPSGPSPTTGDISPILGEAPEGREKELAISALPCDVATWNKLISAYPEIGDVESPTREAWADTVLTGSQCMFQHNFMSKSLDRENSVWVQRMPNIGIFGGQPFKGTEGRVIDGEQAAALARAFMGNGDSRTVPLVHSGIWVRFKAPTLLARTRLHQLVDEDKRLLGRNTGGIVYSAQAIYTRQALISFAIDHIDSYTVVLPKKDQLRSIISLLDYQALLWGLLCAMYPQGYMFHQPCIANPSECNHIEKKLIDFTKMYFMDSSRMTQEQIDFMGKRSIKRTVEEVTKYRESFKGLGHSGEVILKSPFDPNSVSKGLRLILKNATLEDYLQTGIGWVASIEDSIEKTFGAQGISPNERIEHMQQQAAVSTFSEFAHWISEVVYPNGARVVDVPTISQILSDISGDPRVSNIFYTEVMAYIEAMQLGVCVVPKERCPSCQKPMTGEEKGHPYVTPVDAEMLFFTIQDQQIATALIA